MSLFREGPYITIANIQVNGLKTKEGQIREAIEYILSTPSEVTCWLHELEITDTDMDNPPYEEHTLEDFLDDPT